MMAPVTIEDLLTLVSGHAWDDVKPYAGEFVRMLSSQIDWDGLDSEEVIEEATEIWAAIEACYSVDEQVKAERGHPGKVIQIRRAVG